MACERAGYWRLTLDRLRFDHEGLTVTARRLETLQPIGYLVDRLIPGWLTSSTAPGLRVLDWELELPPANPTALPATNSTHAVLSQIRDLLKASETWLPTAELTGGRIRAAGEDVRLATLRWESGHIRGRLETARLAGPVQLEAARTRDDGLSLRLTGDPGQAEFVVTPRATDQAWVLDGRLIAFKNEVALDARWAKTGWLPAEARVAAAELRWPTSLMPPPESVANPGGAFTLDWHDERGRLSLRLEAGWHVPSHAEPIPASLELEAEADLAQARVTRLTLASTPLRVELESPLTTRLADLPALPPFRLRTRLDPGALAPDLVTGGWDGVVAGEARPDGSLPLTFAFTGAELVALGTPVNEASVAGSVEWPVVQLSETRVVWGNLRFQAAATADVAAGAFRKLDWSIEGLPPLAVLQGLPLRSLKADGQITGPFAKPEHAGTLHAELIELAGPHPVSANLGWQGTGMNLEAWDLGAAAGPLTWDLGGSLRLPGLQPLDAEIELERLVWTCDGLKRGHLLRPARLGLRLQDRPRSPTPGPEPAAANSATDRTTDTTPPNLTEFVAQLGPVVIGGDELQLDLAGEVRWPTTGHLELNTAAFPLADLRHLVPALPPELHLESLRASLGWTNGPVITDARSAISFLLPAQGDLRLVTDLRLDRRGLHAAGQVLHGTNESVAQVKAELPWRAEIREGTLRTVRDPESLLSLRVEAKEDTEAWGLLTSRLGLALARPRLQVDVSSRGDRVRGNAEFQATSVRSAQTFAGTQSPPVEQVAVKLDLHEDGLLRADLGFEVAGQRATGRLELPLAPLDLTGEGWAWPPDWGRAQGGVRLPDWSIEALAPWLPPPLLPAGTVAASVRLDPGLALAGEFEVKGLTTRPLPSVGAVREVNVRGRLAPTGIEVTDGRAELSGRPVHFSGFYKLVTDDGPRFRAELAGTNLALVRTSDVFLRGDARIELSGTDVTNATVTGEVKLHDSLLLRELQSLVAGGVQQPESRPPFFSVDVDPFSAWRLDVRVTGDRFLRVVTPVFRGWISTGLQLGGTLREPIAVGEVTVPEGRVVFPFGALAVDQARVSLTREDPFRPHLQVRASGRNFGYDLRLDATGPADAANLVFGSVPPLSSTQVLMMLTTGDVPGEAYSYSTRGKLQNIGMFVGREFLGQLGGDPGEERLTMRTGEEVTDRGQLTYRIEYRLTPRWSLFGEQDRFDTYLGGVIYTLYEK